MDTATTHSPITALADVDRVDRALEGVRFSKARWRPTVHPLVARG